MKKRICSILLTLCMLFCLVPTTAFAAGETNRKVETEQELVDALADSSVDIITLKNDIAIGTTLTVLRKVTLDLNGYVLKMTGSGSVIILDNKSGITGDLTLIDSNPTAEHKFKVNGAEPWVLDDSGTETVYGGIITGGTGSRIFFSNGVEGGGVIIGSGALTMNGGNIVGCIANEGGGLFLSDGSFTMNAGSIVGCSTPNRLTTGEAFHGGIYAFGPMANGDTTGVITLTGGLIKNNGRYAINAAYMTTIYANGGEVYGGVHLNQTSKITCLAEDNGITAFKGKTVIGGASSVNPSHVDWGLFYGGLDIYGNTTGVIVTYKDGDSEYAKQVLPSGTLATRPDAPAATPGYTFGGWNKADGTAWDYASDKVTDNITLYAKWAANTYTITFDTAGGSAIAPITQDYGTAITAPAAPTREGYTFTGWDKTIPATMPAGDMTITAQWTVNQYTITFDTDGGSEIDSIEQDYDTEITAPDAPTKEGYTFIGWDTTVPKKMPAKDMMVKALWQINRYKITFDTAGGSEIAPITQDYGTVITAPEAPEREGYTFIGWDKAIPETMPAENITITARWRDTEKPTGEIIIGTNKWNEFLNELTFGIFFKDTQEVTINAVDNSGVVFVSYLVTDKELSEAELNSLVFRAYEEPFRIEPNGEYIIYVMLVDENINITYLRSDRLTLDNIQPVISGIENGKTYCEAQTVTVDEKNVDTVTVNGTVVTLDADGGFVLPPTNGEQKIVVTDKSGNNAEMTVTVNNGHTFGEWVSDNDGKHTRKCTVDGCDAFETENCSGGNATCTEKAVCDVCGKAYGEFDGTNHEGGVQEWTTRTAFVHEQKWNCCGAVIVASEAHEWKDGVCRECGYVCLHNDTDKNHICDYCEKTISEHEDADKNHVCDYCEKIISEHEDKDKNHICDYCEKIISEHEDKDKNHICDYCEKIISEHEDKDKNHICDYCEKTISEHEDTDKNHICDYCGKGITNHSGGKATCTEKAVCEICNEPYGEIDGASHADLRHIEAKTATKDAEGNVEYWYCEACNKYYSDEAATKEIKKTDTVTAKLPDDSKSPQTGNNGSLMLWIALLFISGGVMKGVTAFDKLKKHSAKIKDK